MTSPLPIDDHHAALVAGGQVATELGVQPAFLRRLDAEQVVRPARTPYGQRRQTRAEIEHLEPVTELAAEGITLARVRRMLTLEAERTALHHELAVERAERRRPRRRLPTQPTHR